VRLTRHHLERGRRPRGTPHRTSTRDAGRPQQRPMFCFASRVWMTFGPQPFRSRCS